MPTPALKLETSVLTIAQLPQPSPAWLLRGPTGLAGEPKNFLGDNVKEPPAGGSPGSQLGPQSLTGS